MSDLQVAGHALVMGILVAMGQQEDKEWRLVWMSGVVVAYVLLWCSGGVEV